MRGFLLLLLCVFGQYSYAINRDSTSNAQKRRNNLVENGLVYFNLFNKDPYHRMRRVSNWAYTRYFKHDFLTKLEYFTYNSSTKHIANIQSFDDLKRGDVMYTSFRCVRAGIGKRLRYKNMIVSPTLTVNYRFDGFEEVFVSMNPNSIWGEMYTEINKLKSLGIGAGCSVGYIFLNRISISTDIHFMHNFDKIRYEDFKFVKQSDQFPYSPNKTWSTLHFRIGIMF